MKTKKALKYILIGLLTIIIIGVLGMVVWSKTGTYPARRLQCLHLNQQTG